MSPIITPPSATQEGAAAGILGLSDALSARPGTGIVPYHRVSSWGQAGPSRCRLDAAADRLVQSIRRAAPGKLRRTTFREVIEGKPSIREARKRPTQLDLAAQYASERGHMLVAFDLSRFLRSEAYNSATNQTAWPTSEEFEWLRARTLGVPLATIVHPLATEGVRLSLATRRTGTAGRPATAMTPGQFLAVLQLLGPKRKDGRWSRPIREVAADLGVSASAINRLLDGESPAGVRWRDLTHPAEALAELIFSS